MQRPPLQPRRQRRALGEAAETGVFLQRGLACSNQRVPTSWISSSAPPSPPPDRRIPTTPPVSLPPGVRSPPASGVDSSLRDRQFPRGELLHRQPAPMRRALQQEHLCAGLLVHAAAGFLSTTYGPVKVWWSRASSAELPTHRALISRSPPFIPIMNVPKGDPCASRCLLLMRDLCSKLSSVELGDFNKAVGREHQLETPTDNAVSLQLKRPSIMPASRGRQTACRHYGALVQSLTATSGLIVVALSCSRPELPVVDCTPLFHRRRSGECWRGPDLALRTVVVLKFPRRKRRRRFSCRFQVPAKVVPHFKSILCF